MGISSISIVLIVFAFFNLVSFAMFVSDKRKAKKGKYRTSENALLLISFFGPFGAVAGMNLARHKTRKVKFQLVYLFVLMQIVLIAYLLWHYGYVSF